MVNYKERYQSILENSNNISDNEAVELKKIMDKYPYFQSAHSIFIKYLKNRELFYKDKLEQVAAKTIDRNVLFNFIEGVSFKKPSQQTTTAFKPKKLITKPKKTLITAVKSEIKENKAEQKNKQSYLEWLKQVNSSKNKKNNDIFDAIDKFLKDKPKIISKKHISTPPPENIEQSVMEKQMLMTETLANLYVKQKKYDKAIQAFKILSLKYPKKSSYFANQIKEIKKLK